MNKKTICTGLLISASLVLTACNQTNETESAQVTIADEQVEDSSTQDLSVDNVDNEEVLVDAKPIAAFIEPSLTFLILTAGHPTVKGDQQAIECYTGADHTFAQDRLQTLLEKDLTPEEITTANEFFNSDIGKRVTLYNRQVPLTTLDAEIENKITQTPTEAAAVSEFFDSDVGMKIKETVSWGSNYNELFEAIIQPVFAKEMSRCGVYVSEDALKFTELQKNEMDFINQ